MIRPEDRFENPVTGEVLVVHRTSEQTNGESVLVETIVRPEGFVAAAHVHPYQSERFEVLEGQLGLRVGEKELIAKPGDVALVPPGTPHRFWNAGEGEARFLCEVRPALQFIDPPQRYSPHRDGAVRASWPHGRPGREQQASRPLSRPACLEAASASDGAFGLHRETRSGSGIHAANRVEELQGAAAALHASDGSHALAGSLLTDGGTSRRIKRQRQRSSR
jgi:quercetin dioxygenase-like cupin family protein